jgi:peptidoglycan/xylan/chitin deacetylase (PgdA/CDA1 family)
MMMWREIAARILTSGPILPSLQRALPARLLTCLTYHRIGDFDRSDPDCTNTSASFAELEWQVAWLSRHARVLDGNEALAYIQGRASFDGPVVCLTFDDGYAESLRIGELLARHRVPGIFFIVSDFVGTRTLPRWYRIAYAVRRTTRSRLQLPRSVGPLAAAWSLADRDAVLQSMLPALTLMDPSEQMALAEMVEEAAEVRATANQDRWIDWPAVRALHALGHSIGAHTRSHPILARLSTDEQRAELAGSRQRIEEELGAPVTLMAYPWGGPHTFDAQTKQLAAACGYQAAFSLDGRRNRLGAIDPFDVCRVGVESSRALFRFHTALPAIAEFKRSFG